MRSQEIPRRTPCIQLNVPIILTFRKERVQGNHAKLREAKSSVK